MDKKNKLSNLLKLPSGGQKDVYSAKHVDYGDVVYKIIKLNSDSLERTKREIRAVLILESSHIPKIYEHNCNSGEKNIWLVEEYVKGKNLRELILSGKTFSINEVVLFIETILSVIVLSESENIIHRDIKPENIILDEDGKFWLLDFGISRHLDLKSITPTNNPYGLFTIGYASSEQFRNFKKDIDSRSDLFSIGIVAYELIKGENFYMQNTNGDVFKVIKKLENESLPNIRLNGDSKFQLSAFIKLLGDHRRNRRPRSAEEALKIFETVKKTLTL